MIRKLFRALIYLPAIWSMTRFLILVCLTNGQVEFRKPPAPYKEQPRFFQNVEQGG